MSDESVEQDILPMPDISITHKLLKKLRATMSSDLKAKDKLQKIVEVIAFEMRATSCSCFVRRAGEVLELFASSGHKDAVNNVRISLGEGVVGNIGARAESLALENAQNHPDFIKNIEEFTDSYLGFCGTPIWRAGKVIGVLVIQQDRARKYSDEEIEILETMAMVVSEIVAMGELFNVAELAGGSDSELEPVKLEGLAIGPGLAIGNAVLHKRFVKITNLISEDPKEELRRLRNAMSSMYADLDEMFEEMRQKGDPDNVDILESYQLFARDRGWLNRIREAITQGLVAESAVQRVYEDTKIRMSQIADPYIRERIADLEDLTNRLLYHLSDKTVVKSKVEQPDNMVVVAKNLGASELLSYNNKKLKALVLEEGTATGHTALIAQALGIPVIGQCQDILDKITAGDELVVDGDNGLLFVRPPDDVIVDYKKRIFFKAKRKANYQQYSTQDAITLDDVKIDINVNAGLLADLVKIAEVGADGVGLYRTEIPFMVHFAYPSDEEQVELYKSIYLTAGDKKVVFRTLDVGGDKPLPYFPKISEENPALGWRGIRMGIDRPAMLRGQLKAMLRAAAALNKDLFVMFPLIAETSELFKAKEFLAIEMDNLRRTKQPLPAVVKIGAVLEVPSLLWQMEELLKSVDFLTVGTNDLLQYLFASDRGNNLVNSRYDSLSPAVLKVLLSIVQNCAKFNVPLSICGEMAGRPLDALVLLGIGFKNLSMSPSKVSALKALVCSVNLEKLKEYVGELLVAPNNTLRSKLRSYAKDHGILLDEVF